MNKVLDILDSMEEIRQQAAENPEQYPVDYTIRLCCAIVSQVYGYENRNDWTEALKMCPESRYHQRLAENRFHL